ncbi:MAG: bifunctional precorrin-2 dehydrogenase/sirohydrochlorin ferrochelatase [Thermoanaerobacterales bacterium]|nr:bifunctional precorrin-2 dehydrogenase/sirohydrochlorin ferrochelatase [Bacillota bacterium]MDI6906793.1 bifunctional precorrin-2 dehydrogenase/sirohydrochlorin ferrochelatase [Thermoanaerobacterales bacterium]
MAPIYPVSLKLEGEPCLVIGGGRVAERKVRSLLAAGARVRVISPDLTPWLAGEALRGTIEHYPRPYRDGDVEGHFLVISAANDPEVNAGVARECGSRRVLLNAVDDPPHCSFFVPASIRRGDFTISVSTAGKSPLLARRVREELERLYGPVYGAFLEYLAARRAEIKAGEPDQGARQRRLEACLTQEVMAALRQGDLERAKELIDGC